MKLKYLAAAAAACVCLWGSSVVNAAEHPRFDEVLERYRQHQTWQQMKEQALSADKLYIVEKDGNYGVLDSKGTFILAAEYEKIRRLDAEYLLLKKDGKLGVSDCRGNIIIPLQYKRIKRLQDGLWLVRDKGWGVLSSSGAELVPCLYEKVRFEQGKFFVQRQDKMGAIAADGRTIWPCEYDSVADDGMSGYIVGETDGFRYYTAAKKLRRNQVFAEAGRFYEGLAAVKVDEKFGYVDSKGEFKIQPAYEKAEGFFEGKALVAGGEERYFIDKDGNKVCAAPEGRYIRGFKDGLAVFKDDGAFHFIDAQEKEHFAFKAATFKKLDNDMYQITRTRHNVSLGGLLQSAFTMVAGIPTIPGVGKSFYDTVLKRGYTDAQGQMLIPTTNDFNSEIIDAKVAALINDKPAWYALDGSYLLPPDYEDVSELDLDNGSMAVVEAEGRSSFYTLGKGITKAGYYAAENFVNGTAPVKVTQSRWTYVDRDFRNIMLNYWQEATPFYGSLAVVRDTKGRYCIIDSKGKVKVILDENIETAGALQPDAAIVQAKGKWGLINGKGRYVAAPEYDSISLL